MRADILEPFIRKQRALLRLGPADVERIKILKPLIDEQLDNIIASFYAHLLGFPESKTYFPDDATLAHVKMHQKMHWMQLFSCNFDEAYAATAIAVGHAHFRHKVPPSLYICGYNFFHCELGQLVCERFGGRRDLSQLLNAVSKVISLDMDLAISVYMQDYWSQPKPHYVD